jgi:hypothetical protein
VGLKVVIPAVATPVEVAAHGEERQELAVAARGASQEQEVAVAGSAT